MFRQKFINFILVLFLAISSLWGKLFSPEQSMAMSPVDESKVPHYFGPYPNWANSPFTLPAVAVNIDAPPTGPLAKQATADAIVGANGAITGFTILNPGSG